MTLNIQAREELLAIVPQPWISYASEKIEWGELSEEHLSLSGQSTVEGVLGEFVDQAGTAQLTKTSDVICGQPAHDVGVMVSGFPWSPGEQVNTETVRMRIEQSLCPGGW